MPPGAGLPRAWWVALATTALQGAPGTGSSSSGFKPRRLLSSLRLRARAPRAPAAPAEAGGVATAMHALESGAWEATSVLAHGSMRSGL